MCVTATYDKSGGRSSIIWHDIAKIIDTLIIDGPQSCYKISALTMRGEILRSEPDGRLSVSSQTQVMVQHEKNMDLPFTCGLA